MKKPEMGGLLLALCALFAAIIAMFMTFQHAAARSEQNTKDSVYQKLPLRIRMESPARRDSITKINSAMKPVPDPTLPETKKQDRE